MNLYNLKKILLYLVLNFIVLVILAEFSLRYIYTPKLLSDRILLNKLATDGKLVEAKVFDYENFRFKPNSLRPMKQVEYAINYMHDQLGYRNPCYKELNHNLEEIILGDSFVYGQGLEDQYTYGCQLIKNGISVYTLGLSGAGISEYLIMIKKNIANIRKEFPNVKKLNLVLFLGNDFEGLVHLNTDNKEITENTDNKEITENTDNKEITENTDNKEITENTDNKEITENTGNKEITENTGNKEINQITNEDPSSTELKDVSQKETEFEIFLRKANRFIVKTPFINQSYTITAIKLLIKPLFFKHDKGDFIKTYAGSTLYKSSVEMPIEQLEKSFSYLIKEISQIGLNFNKIILIEDPAIVDSDRFIRDIRLANFNPKLINLRFKITALKTVCKNLSLSCIDTTDFLKGEDFYIYDNHLKNSGAKRLIKYLSKNFQSN